MVERSREHSFPSRWSCWLGRLSVCLSIAGGLASCQPKPVAELLQVSAVLPEELQLGDSFQVIGDGFALGSAASVRLLGSVQRAGQPARALNLSLTAQTESQRELAVSLPVEVQASLCGDPEVAAHATFRGDVQVAIAAKLRGAPPVTGTLHGAVLELYPATQSHTAEERAARDGQLALSFLGVETALAEDGLTVVRVAPGSRAVKADLRPGDRILRAGGVTVLSPSDLAPEPERTLELGVLRGSSERVLLIDVDGFSTRPPSTLDWSAVVILAVALGFAAWASPLARALSFIGDNWLEQRRLARVISRPSIANKPGQRLRTASWLGHVTDGVGVMVWLGIGAALLSPVLRSAPVDLTLGLLALCFGASTLLAVAALVRESKGEGLTSLLRGIAGAWRQCIVVLPGWIALLSTSCDAGIDFDELVARQGALPWSWNAFANPGLSALFIVLLSTALPRASQKSNRLLHARSLSVRGRGDDLIGWLYLCSTCAIAASAFLGADAWPGMSLGATRAAPTVSLSASVLLLVKYTTLVLLVSFLRRVCSGITTEEWAPIALRICLPISLLGVGLVYAFRAVAALSPFWEWLARSFGPACLLATSVGLLLFAGRIAAAARRSTPVSLTSWS